MEYRLNIEDLSFSFGDKEILKSINLHIKTGSFISIVGPNGSGKTTLLRILSTYLRPQEGIVFLDSQDINNLSRREVSKEISVVPQNTSMEFDYKVRDIVMMGRYPYQKRFMGETDEDKKIVKKSMDYTNISSFSESMFNQLSGGEKQRVILAQALAQEPNILLLDEPVSHLDLQHQIEILDLIKRMSLQDSLTVITVLHDLNLASVYSDYIVMIKEGKVYQTGKPEIVLNKENIKEVFNINVMVNSNPITARPYIYTLSNIKKPKRDLKIHIVCGGGSGSNLISILLAKGFRVSTGVLNIGDSDWLISKEHQINISEEIPFMAISDDAYYKNLELMKEADIIILMPVYFSDSNMKNIEILLEDTLKDKTIYICGDKSFQDRDFSGGGALKLYKHLKTKANVKLMEENALPELFISLDEDNE